MALPLSPINRPIPPEMILELAYGMEEPADVAYRYGFVASEFRALEQHKPFLAEVAAKRAELERGGQTVKIKAAWMTENLLDDLYLRAKDNSATIGQVQETIKVMAKLADLEPKGAQQIQAGPGFSITINLPSIQAKDTAIEAKTETLQFPSFQQPITDVESIDDDSRVAPDSD